MMISDRILEIINMKTLVLLIVAATAFAAEDPEAKTCLEEPDGGLCRGYFPMYYYDPKTQTCKEFIYGGCMGNGNRYGSEEECLDNCRDVVAWKSDSVCSLPAEPGVCYASFPRYYFNKDTGECEKFTYGGCHSNGNNFRTIEECEKKCKNSAAPSICEQEKVVGPCRAAFPRYYFNKETGQCEKFIYGGCNGNENNFLQKEECEQTCIV